MTPVLAASSVTVRVGTKTLIDGISLSLEPGEIAALVGPNGAGKSTLLRVLSGDLVPGTGAVALKGRALRSYGPRALARHRAVLSQSVSVAFSFTVAEIVRMGAGDRRGRTIDELVDAALDQVDLGAFDDHHARYRGSFTCEHAGRYGFTVRIVPNNPDLVAPAELGLAAWA